MTVQLKSLTDITPHSRHIFLSPHFDDAVYSCGGTLGVQVNCGLHPLVITVFAGTPPPGTELSPFATLIHRRMGFSQDTGVETIVATRRKEDARALNYLHADYLWLDYPDAIYRGIPAYYTGNSDLISEVDPGDIWIDKQLAQDLVTLHQRLPDAVWYAPLGVGRHVDHQIVCSAADRLIQHGANVKLYEDFPYVLKEKALENRKEEVGIHDLRLVEMSEFLPVRQQAAARYTSQIDPNFGDLQTLQSNIASYTHGIRPVE